MKNDTETRISETVRIIFRFAKTTAYAGLAFFLLWSILGPEGTAEILRVEKIPEAGAKEVFEILIPKYVLIWTLVTVCLEVVENFIAIPPKFTKYATKKELRDEIYSLRRENYERNIKKDR